MDIFSACRKGKIEVVKEYLLEGGDPNLRNEYGISLLHSATNIKGGEVINLLLDKNADIDKQANNGFTPLHIACWRENLKAVEELLHRGCKVNICSDMGLTPLLISSWKDLEITKRLLAATDGAEPDICDRHGDSPLYNAVKIAKNLEMVKELLKAGATVDPINNKEVTPLNVAVSRGRIDFVKILLNCGADPNRLDSYGKCPSFYVHPRKNRDEIISQLSNHFPSLRDVSLKCIRCSRINITAIPNDAIFN